jgi:hypothetical protein
VIEQKSPTCQRDIATDSHNTQFRQCGLPAVGLINSFGLIWLKACGYHFGQAKRDGYRTRALSK